MFADEAWELTATNGPAMTGRRWHSCASRTGKVRIPYVSKPEGSGRLAQTPAARPDGTPTWGVTVVR